MSALSCVFLFFSVYIFTCSIRSASISLDGTAMVIENIMQIILYWIESAMCMLCGCVDLYDVMHIMFAWHFLLAFFVLLLPPHFAHNSKRLHSHYYYFFFFRCFCERRIHTSHRAYAYDWTEWHIIAAKMIKEKKKWQGEQKERRLAHIWGKRLFHLHLQAIYFYEMNWHAKHSVVTWNENELSVYIAQHSYACRSRHYTYIVDVHTFRSLCAHTTAMGPTFEWKISV